MGEILSYKCNDCGKVFSIDTGIGMLYNEDYLLKENHLIKICEEEKMQNIIEMKEFFEKNKEISIEDYGYLPYFCEECKEILSKFYFVLYDKNREKIIRPIYNCPICKNNLRMMSKDEIKNISCPKCKSKNLVVENFINCD